MSEFMGLESVVLPIIITVSGVKTFKFALDVRKTDA